MSETKEKQKTTTRVVGVLSAIYFRQDENPITGEPTAGPVVARFGDEIELTAAEEKRLERNGALLPKGAKPEDADRHHEARVDAYRAERGDGEALQRHTQRVAEFRDAGKGDIVDVSFDVDSASVSQLAGQIKEQKPNADDTVALAQGDRRLAEKVLEAERLATGGNPRQGVEQQLQKIIDG